MCGIAGAIDFSGCPIDPALLKSMAYAIRHRGPDDEGYVLIHRQSGRAAVYAGCTTPAELRQRYPDIDNAPGFGDIALAHRRFSIIDLSAAGHQPFFAADKSCCVVFNGEIYNYVELREELERLGIRFRTRSDTEVLIEAYRRWGTDCFRRLNGFWALALYDFDRRQLILSRDRMGKRPLYYARVGEQLWFASEIKALLCVPTIASRKAVNRDAVWHWCVDGLRDLDQSTFFEGIHNVMPGTWTMVDHRFPAGARSFWQVPRDRMRESDIGVEEAAREVRARLLDALRVRLRADVTVAFELSGGLDSSAALALASHVHPGRLRSYTVQFAEPEWNEEPFARDVASRFNVDYRVLMPVLNRFWQGIGAFTDLQEEPYHSPNMQVSQEIWAAMRTEGTKVVLTGSSGDEMFAGYLEYFCPAQLENLLSGRWRHFLVNTRDWTERKNFMLGMARELMYGMGMRRPARALKSMLRSDDYVRLPFPRWQYRAATLTNHLYNEITNTRIPYWLMSGDKTLMGLPMEGRCPFLDHRVVELATTLPTTYLLRNGWHKWILRKAVEDLLPSSVVWRRAKMGFPYPYERFFRESRAIVELILASADNPYIDCSRKDLLRDNWRAISFLLWYERFFNQNSRLFDRIEAMAAERAVPERACYVPAFLRPEPVSTF